MKKKAGFLKLVFPLGWIALSAFGQVNDPFSKSVTESPQSGRGGGLNLGDGVKKGLPEIGEKGAKKAAPKPQEAQSYVTEIVAKERLVFDQKGSQAMFVGEVVVSDPRFSLNCDKLTAVLRRSTKETLKEEASGDSSAQVAKGAGSESGESGKPGGGGIEKAIAEGNVLISQEKRNDKGEVERSVGRAQKAIYDAETGNITLFGWPQVEQKANAIVALEESTVIVMNRKGTLDVQGHSKTVLKNAGTNDVR